MLLSDASAVSWWFLKLSERILPSQEMPSQPPLKPLSSHCPEVAFQVTSVQPSLYVSLQTGWWTYLHHSSQAMATEPAWLLHILAGQQQWQTPGHGSGMPGVWICHATLWRRRFPLVEESRADIGEGVGKFWNYLHFLLSKLRLSTLFVFVIFGWVLENGDIGSIERGGRCCHSGVVVYVVHSRCGEQPFSQDRAGTPCRFRHGHLTRHLIHLL